VKSRAEPLLLPPSAHHYSSSSISRRHAIGFFAYHGEYRMSVYHDHKDELDSYQFQMGAERGRLALSLDLLTDALVMVGQHGVYCQSARQAGKPAMDIQVILRQIEGAKALVSDVMVELKRQRGAE
jgi:hypothetical protein